jgi:hypothetical protein
MRDKHEVYDVFRQFSPTPDKAKQAMATLWEAVSCYNEADQERLLLKYARGYLRWLMSGRDPLTAEQLLSIGNNAPDVENGFRYEMGEPLVSSKYCGD